MMRVVKHHTRLMYRNQLCLTTLIMKDMISIGPARIARPEAHYAIRVPADHQCGSSSHWQPRLSQTDSGSYYF
jgi:hypothetical protein